MQLGEHLECLHAILPFNTRRCGPVVGSPSEARSAGVSARYTCVSSSCVCYILSVSFPSRHDLTRRKSGRAQITIQHNVIHGPSEHGMHIKTAPPRGGYVTNVVYFNNTIGNVTGDALLGILTSYGGGGDPAPELTRIQNIAFDTVTRLPSSPTDVKGAGAFKCFNANNPCMNVSFTNLSLDPVSPTPWVCSFMSNTSVTNASPAGLSQECNHA
jgi:hypothetical protein